MTLSRNLSFAAEGANTSGYISNLVATGVTTGTYGGASAIPVISIGTDGRITSAANTTVAVAGKAVAMTFVFGG